MSRWLQRCEVGNNRQTRDCWDAYSSHRAQTTDAVLAAGRKLPNAATSACRSLCVLGAGNCNDVDLAALCSHFGSVTLVDADRDAVASGVQRQLSSHATESQRVR